MTPGDFGQSKPQVTVAVVGTAETPINRALLGAVLAHAMLVALSRPQPTQPEDRKDG